MSQQIRCLSLHATVSILIYSLAVASGCVDTPGWTDSEGDGCSSYVSRKLCTPAGGYGNQWSFNEYGRFEDYANGERLDATEACCGCGKAGLPVATPPCGSNELFEFSANQRCQTPTVVDVDLSQCSTPPVRVHRMGDCRDSDSSGYQVAVSYAPSSAPTGKTCLIVDSGFSVVILSVPHRAGRSVDCSAYCNDQCDKCRHLDLTNPNGNKLVPGNSTLFSIGSSLRNLAYGIDPNCATTDHYTIIGPPVRSIAILPFGATEMNVSPSSGGSRAPSRSPSRKPSQSPRPSPSPSREPSPSPRPSPVPNQSTRPSRSPSASARPSQNPSPSAHPSRSPSPNASPSRSPSKRPVSSPPRLPSSSKVPGVMGTRARPGHVLSVESEILEPSSTPIAPESEITEVIASGRREKPMAGVTDEHIPMGQWVTFGVGFFAMVAGAKVVVFRRTGEDKSFGTDSSV